MAFKVRALIVSMGGLQLGKDFKIVRTAANTAGPVSGDTFNIPSGAFLVAASGGIINASAGDLRVPEGTVALGTTNMSTSSDGYIRVGYKAGSAQIGFVINGTAVVLSIPITGNGGAPVCTVDPAGA